MTKAALDQDTAAELHRHGPGHGPGGRAPGTRLGAQTSDTVTVNITVTDVNEPPDGRPD